MLVFMAFAMTGCVPRVSNPNSANTITALNTATIEPVNTPGMSPARTSFVSEMALTLTPQTDHRRGSYLFPSDIEEEIAEVIQLALEERLSYSTYRGERFFSYVLLKPPVKTDTSIIKAYIYVMDRVYYVDQGELKEGGGGNIPVAVILEEKDNGWRVEIETPISGNQWGSSIREIFPEEVLPLLFHSPPIPYEAIENAIIQQAEEHFGLFFDPVKNGFPPTDSTPTPSVRILTLTPTPTLDLSALEPDVSGRAFITDESISISVDLYQGVSRPFQKGLLSSGWHVYLYERRADHNYPDQDVLVLDDNKNYSGYSGNEFYVEVPLEEVHHEFGDSRGLVYQIVDEMGEVFWQEEIYLDSELSTQYPENDPRKYPEDYPEIVKTGIVIGEPNLLSINIAPVFLPGEKFITVNEPQGGFHSLAYRYNIACAMGITASIEMQHVFDELIIELFPYREDGLYATESALFLSGDISEVNGILQANFPHEWLDKKRDDDQKFYLRIADGNGNTCKEAYIHFIPYIP